jgi:hypothetical protein
MGDDQERREGRHGMVGRRDESSEGDTRLTALIEELEELPAVQELPADERTFKALHAIAEHIIARQEDEGEEDEGEEDKR